VKLAQPLLRLKQSQDFIARARRLCGQGRTLTSIPVFLCPPVTASQANHNRYTHLLAKLKLVFSRFPFFIPSDERIRQLNTASLSKARNATPQVYGIFPGQRRFRGNGALTASGTVSSSLKTTVAKHAGWLVAAVLLTGCGAGGGNSDTAAAAPDSGSQPATNQPPQITSSPQGKITLQVGDSFYEQARASDAEGDNLTFSIENKPAWATFDASSGVLRGNPSSNDVGTYSNIVINVSDGTNTTYGAPFEVTVDESGAATTNYAPTLSGTAPSSANAGSNYYFQPNANDPDGDTLSFSVQNLPGWASFNASTGTLSGTPADADVGLYANITISVSDGSLQTTGNAFSIEVTQVSLGSTTLSWTAPTQNMDGSPLTDLAGYRLYYGTNEGNYTETISVDNPGIVTYVVDNLPTDTYYFVATAYNRSGVESPYSGVAVKVVN
jgi:hypothetical protein